jgi:hypothetical protein
MDRMANTLLFQTEEHRQAMAKFTSRGKKSKKS